MNSIERDPLGLVTKNKIVSLIYYSIGFTKLTLEFWLQISKSGGGPFLISRKILMLVS